MQMFGKFAAAITAALLLLTTAANAGKPAAPKIRHGELRFTPDQNEATAVPKPFQLAAGNVPFEEKPLPAIFDTVRISALTFPSPVHTSAQQNNTVYCEYYRPTSPGKHPACIVLHILGGDFPLSRTVAQSLADRGVAALFVIMPYYGPRRDPQVPTRMVSANPEETVRGMTQAVKDIRYATAWLAAQDEVDPHQLAITGISLGGIVTALAGAVEPRFQKICPVLAGGGIAKMLWDSTEPHMVAARKRWLTAGKTREGLVSLMQTVDPATYGDRIHGRKVLMINARQDEVIPRVATDALWTAFGQPPIVWYQAGHYTAIWHIGDAMERLADFLQPDKEPRTK